MRKELKDMGMYVTVDVVLTNRVGNRFLEPTHEQADKLIENLLNNGVFVEYIDSLYDGMFAFDNTSFYTFDHFVKAAMETVQGYPSLNIEAYFDYDDEDESCKVIINSDGVFMCEKIITYGEPKKIEISLEKGA